MWAYAPFPQRTTMSAGAFIDSRYEVDDGRVMRARVQPETELFEFDSTFNDATTDPITIGWSANMRGSRRQNGVTARQVGVKFAAGTTPTGYLPGQILYVPILTKALYDSITLGGTAQYLGQPCTVVGKRAEALR